MASLPLNESSLFHSLTQMELAKRTDITRSTIINEIIKGKRPISAETAFALGTFFKMDPQCGATSKAATT